MCPQGNVSQMLLGGVDNGSEHFTKFIDANDTILDYILSRAKSPYELPKNQFNSSIDINVNEYNKNLPNNLHLVASHPALDIVSEILENYANNKLGVDLTNNLINYKRS